MIVLKSATRSRSGSMVQSGSNIYAALGLVMIAAVLGSLAFGDFPNTLTWGGVAIILGSGIKVFHHKGPPDTSAPRRKRAGR